MPYLKIIVKLLSEICCNSNTQKFILFKIYSSDLGNWDEMMPGMINLVGTFFIKAATYEFMKYNTMHGGMETHLSIPGPPTQTGLLI